jgi:hypothetical protein
MSPFEMWLAQRQQGMQQFPQAQQLPQLGGMDMGQGGFDMNAMMQKAGPMQHTMAGQMVPNTIMGQMAPGLLGIGASLLGQGQDDKTKQLYGALPGLLGMFGGK